ncbi:hypothetical protein ACFQ3Z_29535 [Streptomyces nogalater]
MARELGTSYAGTVRHLVNLRLLNADRAAQWSRIPPSTLRSSLAGGAELPGQAHVHVITEATDGQIIYADAADVLVLHLPGAAFDALPKGLEQWTSDGPVPLTAAVMTAEMPPGKEASVQVNVPARECQLRLTVVREVPRCGVDEVWPA